VDAGTVATSRIAAHAEIRIVDAAAVHLTSKLGSSPVLNSSAQGLAHLGSQQCGEGRRGHLEDVASAKTVPKAA
jgi:hypothetical protein